MDEPEKFSEVLVIDCLELWTVEDYERKFKTRTTAHAMHKLVRRLLKDAEKGLLKAGGADDGVVGGANWTKVRVATKLAGALTSE